MSFLLLFSGSGSLIATTRVVGRVVGCDGRAEVGAGLSFMPFVPAEIAVRGSTTELSAQVVRVTLDSAGAFAVGLVPATAWVPSGVGLQVRLLDLLLGLYYVPIGANAYLDGVVASSVPAWTTVTTCILRGRLLNISGDPLSGVTLFLGYDTPLDRPLLLADHTYVLARPVSVVTDEYGEWQVPIIPTTLLTPVGVQAVLTLPGGRRVRFTVPNSTAMWLNNLL